MPLYTFGAKHPTLAPAAWVAPSASLLGDARLAAGTSIWFGALLRGADDPTTLGLRRQVQAHALLHCAPGSPPAPGCNL